MRVASITFKENKKEYYFKSDDKLKVKIDDLVVVDTVRGPELAKICNPDVKNSNIPAKDLMPILRKASKKDQEQFEKNLEMAQIAHDKFVEILKEFPGLEMSLVETEYNLDQSKLLFMYVSDDRVDFRELLKVLASNFKTRIELKQIGARDKAKLVGGLGPCGMVICCTRFLKEFDNISINMAKNQMLSLNPVKISGLCGRLLCCLKYENDQYSTEKKSFPKLGTHVQYEGSNFKVTGLNILLDQVKIEGCGIVKFIDKKEIKW
ncbi:regulatory iron-sulfur-containing complex subunit RicT [Mycoplasma sp. P36-A1]|uniref:regulatory iron-sulfur-containing complex subunit RicT n=1 Tax=Mycoplasma sp. P36-A1 TaxID=3252900 RepID=UPI003C30926B